MPPVDGSFDVVTREFLTDSCEKIPAAGVGSPSSSKHLLPGPLHAVSAKRVGRPAGNAPNRAKQRCARASNHLRDAVVIQFRGLDLLDDEMSVFRFQVRGRPDAHFIKKPVAKLRNADIEVRCKLAHMRRGTLHPARGDIFIGDPL